MATGTSNPAGSTAVEDLLANTINFDNLSVGTDPVYTDRLGVARKSIAGFDAETDQVIEEAKTRLYALNYRGDWVTGTAYAVNDVYKAVGGTYDGSLLQVLFAHTSSGVNPDADYAAQKVVLLQVKKVPLVAYSIAELKSLVPENAGQVFILSAGGRSGEFEVLPAGNYSAEIAADPLEGVYIELNNGQVLKRQCETSDLEIEWFGAVDGNSAALAMLAAVDVLPVDGGTVKFSDSYSGISQNIRILRGKVKIKGVGWNRLTFNSGFGLILGEATVTSGQKQGTKVVEIGLEDFHVTGQANYNGTLTKFEYADQVTTINYTSAPVNIAVGSGALCTGLEVMWVQWWEDFAGTFSGNHRGIFWNFTQCTPNNEDHFHLYGTRNYIQKGLVSGVVAASMYVKFENGRTTGASEVSFNGCHIAEFAEGDNSDVYGFVVDLDGNNGDKKPFRSVKFNSCMIEQPKYMFDVATLNSESNGKDVGSYVFDSCYFVGNLYRTDTLFKGDVFKTRATFRDCNVSAITTLFDGILSRFEGRNDFGPYTTFSTNSYASHDFVGASPILGFRTKRKGNFTLPAGDTTYVLSHALVDTPNFIQLQLAHDSTWWVSARDSTTITIEFGTASASAKVVQFYVDIVSSQ